MKKRHEVFLAHMIEALEKIERYIKGYKRADFLVDEKTIDAVVRQFEIIGEAASKIPKFLVKDSPVPWTSIVSLRNRLIHEYFGVDYDIVWKTAKEGLGELVAYLKKKLHTLESKK